MARNLSLWALMATFMLQHAAMAQQIYDVWTTTYDKSKLFEYDVQSPPLDFTTPGADGDATISVDDTSVYQTIHGFGGTLTDGAAVTLSNLKKQNSSAYYDVLNKLFDPADQSFESAGMSYLRVPLGASDFSATVYSYDDSPGDTQLSNFSIDAAPQEVFQVIGDIQQINSGLKVHFVPWSPPGWMKDSGKMTGGSLKSSLVNTYAQYLLKSLQGWEAKGVTAFALSIQNEPENDDSTYPTCSMSPEVEGQIGNKLRQLMNDNGFTNTKLIGFEHNWIHAAEYPVTLLGTAQDAFDGVSFHCYEGQVGQQDSFSGKFPGKEVYFTECAGTIGSDFWSDLKFDMDNLFIGALEHSASSALEWFIASDPSGGPKLPGTDSCGGSGCRAIVTINSDGSYVLNQEFFAAAHASKAIIPKDAGGPTGQRIAVSTGGDLGPSMLRVGAYVTQRANPNDFLRYSLVVVNWDDSGSGTPISTTIDFRGVQAKYTFPVGVTTLTWYAPSVGSSSGSTSRQHAARRHHRRHHALRAH